MELGDKLDQAVGLAGMEIPVFFLAEGSKIPEAGTQGFRDATVDEEEIWDRYSPEKNLAIATGDGLLVLDLDVYKQEGIDSYKRLVEEYGQLPETVTANTARGGKHYFYRVKEPIASSANVGGYKGIDLKAEGGYVVAPPSVVGKPYAWASGLDPWTTEIADAPGWLLSLCRKRRVEEQAEPEKIGWREVTIRQSRAYKLAEKAGLFLGWAEDKGDPRGKCLVRCPREGMHSTPTQSSHSFLRVGDSREVLHDCYHGSCEPDGPRTPAFLEACLELIPEEESTEEDEAPEEWRYVPISKLEPRSLDDWLWTGFVAPGRLTILSAEPKAGKTTFLSCLYRSFASDGDFLGQEIRETKILVASEESPDNWLSRKEQIGLEDHVLVAAQPPIAVGDWDGWANFCLSTKRQAQAVGAGLVVFDTANFLFPTEDENSVADTKRALESTALISRAGIAVIFAAHVRKSGGDAIASLRGSSALSGAADFVLSLSRVTDREDDTRRRIVQRGRYVESPSELTCDYDSDGYCLTSIVRSVEDQGARRRILSCLPVAPDQGTSMSAIRRGCAGHVSHKRIDALLYDLVREGEVERIPAGTDTLHESWRRRNV